MNPTALTCIAVLGLLVFGLGAAISLLRLRDRRLAGHADDPSNLLHKLVRAHGNTTEYAPFLAVLFLVLGSREPAPSTLWLIVAATAFRVLIVIGLIAWPTMARPNPLRFIGALGAYVTGAALCVALLRGL